MNVWVQVMAAAELEQKQLNLHAEYIEAVITVHGDHIVFFN